MDELRKYKIIYTDAAIEDIENKADYIAFQLRDPDLAEKWYLRLRRYIQDIYLRSLSNIPCMRKFPESDTYGG